MENLTTAANIIAEHFEAEKAKFEKASTDYFKASFQRRAQMLLDALTLICCLSEPISPTPIPEPHETNN